MAGPSDMLKRPLRAFPPIRRMIEQRDRYGAEVDFLREEWTALMGRMAAAPWGPALLEAQRTVAGLSAARDYAGDYGAQEILYWSHIPGWLATDAAADPPDAVLDIGAKYGTLALFCRTYLDCRVVATDAIADFFSPELTERWGIEFAVGNVERDRLPGDATFDVVILTEVLEHFNFHPVPTLRAIRRRIAPGGRLYLSTPDADEWGRDESIYPRWEDMPQPDPEAEWFDGHVYVFSADELGTVLGAAGFVVERLEQAPGRWHRHLNVTARNP